MRERQHEPGFDWKRFKELIKDYFSPLSLEKAKENEFMQLQEGRMSALEYASMSKFMELSCFSPALMANERMKIYCFEVSLNPGIKGRMSVQQYTSYVILYDTTVNMERAMRKEANISTNSTELKGKGINKGTSTSNDRTGGLLKTPTRITMHVEANTLTLDRG